MHKLILLTCQPGLNKIRLIHELRAQTDLSLRQAKQYIVDLLDGGNPVIFLASLKEAEELLAHLQSTGIEGRIEEERV